MIHNLKDFDESKFRELLDSYFIRLKEFAHSFLRDEGLSEEVVMDVFLKLWKNQTSLDKIDHLKPYLFIAVRNTCYNYLRQEKKHRFASLDQVHVNLVPFESTPEDDLVTQEMLGELNRIVELLPSKCKMIFKLLREEGLSRKDTAKVLNISANTVDNQVAIAVRKIGEALGLDLTIKRNLSELQSFLFCL